MKQRRTTEWGAVCSAALTLVGCSSTPTHIYSVEPIASASRIEAYRVPALRVDILNVPAGWDRMEILQPSSVGSLEISDFDHWAAPLAQMVRQTLSEDLDQRLPPGSLIYPRLPKPTAALGVDVDILDFRIGGTRASMRASWIINAAEGAQRSKRSEAELQTSVSSTAVPAVVAAWSNLVGQLADRIGNDAASFDAP
jgi:hypothetical protein